MMTVSWQAPGRRASPYPDGGRPKSDASDPGPRAYRAVRDRVQSIR